MIKIRLFAAILALFCSSCILTVAAQDNVSNVYYTEVFQVNDRCSNICYQTSYDKYFKWCQYAVWHSEFILKGTLVTYCSPHQWCTTKRLERDALFYYYDWKTYRKWCY